MATGILVYRFIHIHVAECFLDILPYYGVNSRYLSNVAVFNKGRPQNAKNSHRSSGFSVSHC